MSDVINTVRKKLSRKVSHKDPNPNFSDDDASTDEETSTYVNKEVDDTEKEGDKYPMGRPNSFLNRMISHGNKKTEDQIAREMREAESRNAGQHIDARASQATGGGQNVATGGAQNVATGEPTRTA